MKTILRFVAFFFCVTFAGLNTPSFWAQAQNAELIDFSVEATADGTFAVPPRDQLQRDAVQKTAEKLIREMVGDAKYDRNRVGIQNRVIRQAERFIPLVRLAEPTKTEKGYKGLVSLKVSVKDLKEVLTKEGFLYLTESLPTVLPLIEVVDRARGGSYRWWVGEAAGGVDAQVKQLHGRLIEEMRREMGTKGFYLMDPASGRFRDLLPLPYRTEGHRSEDVTALGEFFRASIVLRGRMVLDRDSGGGRGSQMRLELTGIQTENGRAVAELIRNFESKTGGFDYSLQQNMTGVTQEVAKELAGQFQEIWQRGTLGSSIIRVVLLGDVSFQDIESFKREVQKIPSLKRVMERRISWEGVVFEADVNGPLDVLAKRLSAVPLPQGKIELRSQSTSEIVLKKVQ